MNRALLDDFRRLPQQTHISAFYGSATERHQILSAYYQTGIENKELCIFVTHQEPKHVISSFKRQGLDISELVETGSFHIFPTNETYLPDGGFKSSEMLDNLRHFVKQGLRDGFTGVRGGGDMDWLARRVPGRDQVFDYECKINRFVRSNAFTGICLLPTKLLNDQRTQTMVQNHQFIVKNSQIVPNPYYEAQEKAFKLDLHLVSEIETWLDWLDKRERATNRTLAH